MSTFAKRWLSGGVLVVCVLLVLMLPSGQEMGEWRADAEPVCGSVEICAVEPGGRVRIEGSSAGGTAYLGNFVLDIEAVAAAGEGFSTEDDGGIVLEAGREVSLPLRRESLRESVVWFRNSEGGLLWQCCAGGDWP